MNLTDLSVPDAQLVQHGLKALGFYSGTTRGLPGPNTQAAYDRYLHTLLEPTDSASDFVTRLVEILEGEVGVREVPKNSNRGDRVEEYQDADWLDYHGYAWCASFVCWTILQLSKTHPLSFDRPKTAGAWDFERWARTQAGATLFKPRTKIKKGDILVFTFSHIGWAVEDEKWGSVMTIEGNTNSSGSREGGGVYKQKRKTSLVRSNIRLS